MGKELIQLGGGGAGTALTETSAHQVAQAESEVKAAVVMAKQFPRSEMVAYSKLAGACSRPAFAAAARYCFPRGGKDIDGLSIGFAREAARVWGNIQHGIRLVGMTEEQVHVKGWAWDLETNVRTEREALFNRRIQRKGKGWVEPDERDLRELVAKHGAVAVRGGHP